MEQQWTFPQQNTTITSLNADSASRSYNNHIQSNSFRDVHNSYTCSNGPSCQVRWHPATSKYTPSSHDFGTSSNKIPNVRMSGPLSFTHNSSHFLRSRSQDCSLGMNRPNSIISSQNVNPQRFSTSGILPTPMCNTNPYRFVSTQTANRQGISGAAVVPSSMYNANPYRFVSLPRPQLLTAGSAIGANLYQQHQCQDKGIQGQQTFRFRPPVFHPVYYAEQMSTSQHFVSGCKQYHNNPVQPIHASCPQNNTLVNHHYSHISASLSHNPANISHTPANFSHSLENFPPSQTPRHPHQNRTPASPCQNQTRHVNTVSKQFSFQTHHGETPLYSTQCSHISQSHNPPELCSNKQQLSELRCKSNQIGRVEHGNNKTELPRGTYRNSSATQPPALCLDSLSHSRHGKDLEIIPSHVHHPRPSYGISVVHHPRPSYGISDSNSRVKILKSSPITFDMLPSLVILKILSYVSLADLVLRVRQTSRYLYAISHDPSLWTRVICHAERHASPVFVLRVLEQSCYIDGRQDLEHAEHAALDSTELESTAQEVDSILPKVNSAASAKNPAALAVKSTMLESSPTVNRTGPAAITVNSATSVGNSTALALKETDQQNFPAKRVKDYIRELTVSNQPRIAPIHFVCGTQYRDEFLTVNKTAVCLSEAVVCARLDKLRVYCTGFEPTCLTMIQSHLWLSELSLTFLHAFDRFTFRVKEDDLVKCYEAFRMLTLLKKFQLVFQTSECYNNSFIRNVLFFNTSQLYNAMEKFFETATRLEEIVATGITDKVLNQIRKSCCKIKHLAISSHALTMDPGDVPPTLTLESLAINCTLTGLTDLLATRLVKTFPRLRAINLTGIFCSDEGQEIILKRCTKLEVLHLEKQPVEKLPSCVKAFAFSESSLSHLHESDRAPLKEFSVCADLDDRFIRKLCSRHPTLTSLSLADCPCMTDASLVTVAELCPMLTHFSLTQEQSHVSAQGVYSFLKTSPRLVSLEILAMNNKGRFVPVTCKLSENASHKHRKDNSDMGHISSGAPNISELHQKSSKGAYLFSNNSGTHKNSFGEPNHSHQSGFGHQKSPRISSHVSSEVQQRSYIDTLNCNLEKHQNSSKDQNQSEMLEISFRDISHKSEKRENLFRESNNHDKSEISQNRSKDSSNGISEMQQNSSDVCQNCFTGPNKKHEFMGQNSFRSSCHNKLRTCRDVFCESDNSHKSEIDQNISRCPFPSKSKRPKNSSKDRIPISQENKDRYREKCMDTKSPDQCQVREITLGRVPQMTLEDMTALTSLCPDLLVLRLTGCLSLDDQSIEVILRGCPKLRSLSLERQARGVTFKRCPLTDHALQLLATRGTQLQHFKALHCYKFSPLGLARLIMDSKTLGSLSLSVGKFHDLKNFAEVNHEVRRLSKMCSPPLHVTLGYREERPRFRSKIVHAGILNKRVGQ